MESSTNTFDYYTYAKDFRHYPGMYKDSDDDEAYHDFPDIITNIYKLCAKIDSISCEPESKLVILTSIEKLPTIINSIMNDWAQYLKSRWDTSFNKADYENPFPTDYTVNKLEQLFVEDSIIKIVDCQYFYYKKYTITIERI
jgi:hypothetical protein